VCGSGHKFCAGSNSCIPSDSCCNFLDCQIPNGFGTCVQESPSGGICNTNMPSFCDPKYVPCGSQCVGIQDCH
jgi:hypothetical protein